MITDRSYLCVFQVGERDPAPTQNQRALGGNLHLLQLVWTMERLPGESLLGAAVAGETATQGWLPHLANLVNSSFSFYAFSTCGHWLKKYSVLRNAFIVT